MVSPATFQKTPRRRRTFKEFLKKYFLAGQKTIHDETAKDWEAGQPDFLYDSLLRYRKPLSILIPFLFIQTVYWILAIHYGFYKLFATRYEMSIVMIFGSFIGGATAEGGGAVAYPVLTLALHVSPVIARDFSVMIQSVGMLAGGFAIFFMGIVVEGHAIIFATLGGAVGSIFSLHMIDPYLPPTVKKLIFVSFFFAFALALFYLNWEKKRLTVDRIHKFTWQKAVILFCNGVIGGIFTAICGSGMDVYIFSILCLLFRVSEKVATPTTISLSWFNSIICFFWRYQIMNAIEPLAWEFFAVCVPVVIIFSPIGGFLSSYCHRLTLACVIYVLETVSLITAFVVIRPPLPLIGMSVGIIVVCFIYYFILGKIGRKNIPEGLKQLAAQKAAESGGPNSSGSFTTVNVDYPHHNY